MLGIETQWAITINGDEIHGEELSEFRIIDEAGLSLPTLELNLNLKDHNKMRRYTEPGYVITVGVGRDAPEETMEFQVFKKMVTEGAMGSGYYFIKLWCILNHPTYLDEQRMVAYQTTDEPKRSDEVWETVCGRYGFNPDTTPFKDKMLWLQYNTTDRRFLDELTWHGFFNDDDPCLHTIRRDKKARYLPMSQLKSKVGTIGNSTDYDFHSNYWEFTQNEGFLSVWGGAERVTPLHTLEEGTDDEVDILNHSTVKVKQQILKKGVREDNKRFTEYQFIGDNVHSNWWRAYEQNRILKSSLNAINVEFHFNKYHSIYPLDYFEVQWKRQIEEPEESTMVIPITGEWLATRSEIIVSQGEYQQKIRLAREQLMT